MTTQLLGRAEKTDPSPIPIDVKTHLWGVVTFVIHKAE